MNRRHRQPITLIRAYALLLFGLLFGALSAQAAITPAGTVIKNLATVTYQDSLGNAYTAQSNESAVIVAEVYAAELQHSQTKDAAPGQTVYFPHQLTNNGNTPDSFNLAATASQAQITDLKIFQDTNNNGQPDVGEGVINSTYLPAGETIHLVVAAQISSEAKGSLQLTLKATSKAKDTKPNNDTINVVEGPVLVAKKQVIKNSITDDLGEITYRITVTNNGSELSEGALYDFFPDFMDIEPLAGHKTQAGLGNIEIKDSGNLKTELPSDSSFIAGNNHEKALFVPINKLSAGATVALQFTVHYKLKGGTKETPEYYFDAEDQLKNKAIIGYGTKTSTSTSIQWGKSVETNTVVNALPFFSNVKVTSSDGQEIALPENTVPAGGVAEFINTITNLGNGADTFNLKLENTSFPKKKKTVFTLWDKSGKIPLTDTNGDGIIDTGKLQNLRTGKDNTINILIRAQLPFSAENFPYQAKLIATSVKDSNVSDFVTEKLTSITAGNIDLANYKIIEENNQFNGEVHAITDFFKKGASDNYDPFPQIESTLTLNPGDTGKFGLYIANKSATSSSFTLSTELFSGVTFQHDGIYDKDGNTIQQATGEIITVTPNLPGGTVMKVIAHFTISPKMPAGNIDPVFVITSNTSGLADKTQNRVTVRARHAIELSPSGNGQVEAGSTLLFEHKLTNHSNESLDIQFSSTTKLGDWNYIIYTKASADDLLIQLKTDDSINLASGEEKNIVVKILAPANASPDKTFTLELIAQGKKGEDIKTQDSITDTVSIIKGQIRLYKKALVLIGQGRKESAILSESKQPALSSFEVNSTKKPAPGTDYVVWQIIAQNKGSAPAKHVTIRDAAPAFTTLVNDSWVVIPENKGVATGDASSGQVTFGIGDKKDNKDFTADQGGTLQPGESVEVRFTVKVN
ncbi:hypothetical protein CI610_00247 [invertebrate metagenome]|uniref:Uncharacterized protein n=1 Tax=invertebrate metagenome TaxID=1711999 RepID=A0A2H9TC43_9ZZZZ